jgi:hypothetical protein
VKEPTNKPIGKPRADVDFKFEKDAFSGKGRQNNSGAVPAISGVVGAGAGRLSPEEQAAALVALRQTLGDDVFTAVATKAAPADESDVQDNERTNAAAIKLDDVLASALVGEGYERVAKLTYRADWSTADVEHILLFSTYGSPKEFLTGELGVRNKEAESFAEGCRSRYADPIIRNSDFVPPRWWCWLHCSLGSLANWPGANLFMPNFASDELKRKVTEAVTGFLRPYVGAVTTVQRLFDFLAQDSEPMRWFRTGPYFRAAEVVYLGRKLGVPSERLQEIARPYSKLVANGIDLKAMTPEEYILRIIKDADAALSAGGEAR